MLTELHGPYHMGGSGMGAAVGRREEGMEKGEEGGGRSKTGREKR